MSPKRRSVARKLRGAQKWIVDELRAVGPGVQLATAQIAKRVAKSSQKKFHRNSIYNALRLLVRRGDLQVTRKGHEKLYRVGSGAPAPPPAAAAKPARRRAAPRVPAGATAEAELAAPHRLGLGDILVLEVGSGYIVTVTNLHGKLVVDRTTVP